VAFADDDGQCVVTAGARGPAARIVGEDDAAGAELVNEGRRIGRAGHLGPAEPASRMARAARCGRIWSSRTYVFFGLPESGRVALV
jgi:hypothetical protein